VGDVTRATNHESGFVDDKSRTTKDSRTDSGVPPASNGDVETDRPMGCTGQIAARTSNLELNPTGLETHQRVFGTLEECRGQWLHAVQLKLHSDSQACSLPPYVATLAPDAFAC